VYIKNLSELRRVAPPLQITPQRLGEAAAYTNFHAGDRRSISHYLFRGATAAVAPNRKLHAGILSLIRDVFYFHGSITNVAQFLGERHHPENTNKITK
jgi:hypothetical protein